MEGSTVDDTLRNRDAGRDAASHDAGDDSPASRDSAQPGSGPAAGDDSTAAVNTGDIVTICGWCPQLHILSIQRRDVDVISIVLFEKKTVIFRNGTQLKISHGICAPCSERLHPRKEKP
jgi:hypothetical protein